jgi:CRISPR/Cas system-associated protein endoribonuclease Cas2
VSFARQETHLDRIKKSIPPEGKIRAFYITRAQWERAFIIYGSPEKEGLAEEMPEQIQLW